jgi:hypothetical protein
MTQLSTGAPAKRPYLGTARSYVYREEYQGLAGAKRLKIKQKRISQSLLYDKQAEKQHPVCWCERGMRSETVLVYRASDGNDARLHGLSTCKSVWSCPTCSALITEVRRKELIRLIAKASSQGVKPFLMTLTFPHGREDDLPAMLEKFGKALHSFKNAKAYKALLGTAAKPGRAGRIGSVRSLEVTWGEANGWHPHTHDLTFCTGDMAAVVDSRAFPDDPESTLRQTWFKALRKAGLASDSDRLDVLEHGLDVRDGTYAAEYVAKYGHEAGQEGWGLSGELTRSHAKVGLNEGRFTPFQLLTLASNGDQEAGRLFKEFSWAFLGKRMLLPTPGLYKRFDEVHLDDSAFEDEPMRAEIYVGELTVDQFHQVVKHDAQADLLDYAARYAVCQLDLDDWVAWLTETKATMSGAIRKRRHFGGSGPLELYQ